MIAAWSPLDPLTGLASHSQVEVAIPVDEVAGGAVHQLADADARVAQDADDQLVALGHGDVFKCLDLVTAQQEDGDQRIAVLADGLRGEAASSAGGRKGIDQLFESHTGDLQQSHVVQEPMHTRERADCGAAKRASKPQSYSKWASGE
jgi:hypothetical protein